ncbi:MAG: PD40 domain-containing protein [Flavobacteriales bacterium]|nr:PD40 domain-containing protein [Flavobacteriales bacterium]
MKKISTIITLFFITSFIIKAQDIPFEKSYFKDRKDEFKDAKSALDEANTLYEQGYQAYKVALSLFLKAQNFNPNNAEVNYKVGKCYLYSSYKTKATPYLEKALELNPNVAQDIRYFLGRAYHLEKQWDKAISEYKKYRNTISGINAPERFAEVDKRIEECGYGKKYEEKTDDRVFIDNIGKDINTDGPEYGAIISADESMMIFTSRRPNTTGGQQDPFINEYFEDIYIAYKEKGKWLPAQNIGKPVNTEGHDASVALAPDGQKLIIYIDDKGDGNLYECRLEGATWSKPKKLDNNTINTKEHESSASYAADGKTLYFVSNRQGGLGGRDIWYSRWDDKNQKWGAAINMGATINTKYNEESVVIHPDGKTLYFSSEGHSSSGGYDIFKSELKNGSWQKPENIGYPINTPDDDVFFVISGSGRRGYYSSVKKDTYGEKDVYVITFLGPEKPYLLSNEDNLLASRTAPVTEKIIEKPVESSSKKITILKGAIKEMGSLKPIKAEIELIDVEENTILATFESNSSSGKYLVSLPSGKNYGLAVKAEGYLFHSENFNIPDDHAFKEIEKDILLQKLEVGSKIILKNIFYDYNKATLRPSSMNELDRLYNLLVKNPSLKVELSAHTDSRGGDAYNNKLSEERAQSCVDYLTQKGISKDRLIAKGYGKQQLLISDAQIAKIKSEEEKEEAHQQNRRTEFKILSK